MAKKASSGGTGSGKNSKGGGAKSRRENYKKRFFNQDLPVLFEEFDPKSGYAYGHTSNYLLVKIKSEKPLHGKMLLVTYNNETASD